MRFRNAIVGSLLVIFSAVTPCSPASADSKPDEDMKIEVPANGASRIYERPTDADYFWWDFEPAIDVELVFVDGEKKTVKSDAEFSKRITSVRFVNRAATPAHGELHIQY